MKASSADFFNKDSLQNFSFYYHLPDIDWKQKTELSLKIQNNQGVIINIILLLEKFFFTVIKINHHNRKSFRSIISEIFIFNKLFWEYNSLHE